MFYSVEPGSVRGAFLLLMDATNTRLSALRAARIRYGRDAKVNIIEPYNPGDTHCHYRVFDRDDIERTLDLFCVKHIADTENELSEIIGGEAASQVVGHGVAIVEPIRKG